jgi:hypothetical protein
MIVKPPQQAKNAYSIPYCRLIQNCSLAKLTSQNTTLATGSKPPCPHCPVQPAVLEFLMGEETRPAVATASYTTTPPR